MPITNKDTHRQTVIANNGAVLSRQYLYMDEPTWALLQSLCIEQHLPGSQVIQSLIKIAALGMKKEKHDEFSKRTN